MRVISPTRIFDSNARLSSQILFEDPEFQNQQLARKAVSIVRQALTPQSVLFSFPPTLFAHRTDAYKSIEDNIGPLTAVRPLSLYSIQARGDLLIEAKFASHEHATKAIQVGITIDDIVYKASPSVAGVEKPLVRVQLNLLRMASDEELREGLLSSMRYYGKVYQVRQTLCNGYFEGQLTVTLDPSQGYVDTAGKRHDSQPLQRMLYLEKWDVFAPASFKGADPVCYYCRQAGHIRSACPDLAKRRCFGCGETGHTKRFCTVKIPAAVVPESETESDLLDKYIADATADTTTTPIIDQLSGEINENPACDMEEDNTRSDEEDHESRAQEEDIDMDNDETSSVNEADVEDEDPAASLLGSKWAPEDQAVVMKVDDPAEMLNLSKVKETTKAKSATIKRRLLKKSTSTLTLQSNKSTVLNMKPVVPSATKLQSSARRAL